VILARNNRTTISTVSNLPVNLSLGLSEQVSLHEIAAKRLKTFKLRFGFNTLCNDPHVEALRHAGNQFNDIKGIILRGYRIHKGFIYFNFIKIQFTQSRERGISRSEIIDGNFDTQRRSFLRIVIGMLLSLKSEDSVTSSSSRLAGSPVSFRMDCTIAVNDFVPS
jgi:hypothetical protein